MNIIERVKGMMLGPQREWEVIESERGNIVNQLVRYVAILAAIPAICAFIGYAIVGISIPRMGSLRIGYGPALVSAIINYVMAFVSVYVVALIADTLAPTFNAERGFPEALKLAAYSYTPVWLFGAFLLVPSVSFLRILGLYGVYLLWLGLPPMMRAPERESSRLLYCAAILVSALILWYGVRYVVSLLLRVSVWSM
jgi:Yip1-like protein